MVSSSIIGPTLFGSTPSQNTKKSNNVNPIISFSHFGNCDKKCPEHSVVGGEITKLVFVHYNENIDVPPLALVTEHCCAPPLDYYS